MNNDCPFDFGIRLKELREEYGYSRADIAKKLDISESSIKRYENNTQSPPIETLEQLAIIYRKSLDYLRNMDDRKCIYVDQLSEEHQELVISTINEMIDKLKKIEEKK